MAAVAADSRMERRIVLLGKTGSGKSSLANTILGEGDLFKVCHSSTSGTAKCQFETRDLYERRIQLIDTPGFFDTDPNAPDMKKEVLKCMLECASGVHAFLLVLKVERFTKHELSVSEVFCKHFSEEALNYTTVVFTQGDQLEGTPIKEWIKDNKDLSALVEKCGGRCHVFDNKYWKNSQDLYQNNQVQLKELIKTIDETVEKNGGKCYTNDMLQKVQTKLKEETETIRADPQNANMSDEEVEKKAEENAFEYFWAKVIVGAFGVAALLGVVLLKF